MRRRRRAATLGALVGLALVTVAACENGSGRPCAAGTSPTRSTGRVLSPGPVVAEASPVAPTQSAPTSSAPTSGAPATEPPSQVATPTATALPAAIAARPSVSLPTVSLPPVPLPLPRVSLPPIGPPPTPGAGVPGRLFGRDWDRIPTDRKVVALTFDAGANADGVGLILATLTREHVPATFFLTGDFADDYPAQARNIAVGGFRLGNYSATHPSFTTLTDSAIRDQILGAEHDIRVATGGDPRPLFRFPFGERDQRTIAAVNTLGYVTVRWTVDTLGWQGTSGGRSAESVTSRVVAALTPGEIVLLHLGSHPQDHSTLDADALPEIIAALRDRGYGFVTLASLLA
ncbi:polysaccharide deacetylase family protein [Frankia sp. AgB1.9]|uniref:polysaccharide deacetylase family protein n=1 Tax=unclassified Frankia TaxID=2632575 RepID=UPI001932D4B8|nr:MULTISPECIES: polysaccharide deacetylase family protein [unclassified Frankia]MBL7493750.1 polysaccharide deacetylase family protein [Frankia sp. AgW1.1]MBL7553045.1 polysaccharide deacetylase family protein [Frankia sp. AgB1.9]MBL7620523.1 polysaccharide deacetylase family protein [Frankia sp. AgB1.8]